VRTLLYEAANVMLARYKGQLKLKDWAFAIARRSTLRKARVALARRLSNHHARDVAERNRVRAGLGHQSTRQETASSSRKERRSREGADDGADCVACGQPTTDCDFNQAALHPAYPIKRRRARREHTHPQASKPGKSLPSAPGLPQQASQRTQALFRLFSGKSATLCIKVIDIA
jgi:hypothetical protein